MNNFRYYTPTQVEFGRDAENKTGEYAAKYGSRALLVFGRESVVKSGLLSSIAASLDRSGIV